MAASPLVSPLVSVIIPALNASATLGRALDSVRAQTYPYWEAIVIDDGSSDDTVALVERRGDPRCRVIRRFTRGGPSRARNDGIAAAKGALIALLDADDEWLPEKLARQVAALARHPAASLVVCDMRAIHEDGSAGSSVFTRQAPSAGPEAWKALLASSFIGTSAVLAPRDLVRDIGGFDASLAVGEDQDCSSASRYVARWLCCPRRWPLITTVMPPIRRPMPAIRRRLFSAWCGTISRPRAVGSAARNGAIFWRNAMAGSAGTSSPPALERAVSG